MPHCALEVQVKLLPFYGARFGGDSQRVFTHVRRACGISMVLNTTRSTNRVEPLGFEYGGHAAIDHYGETSHQKHVFRGNRFLQLPLGGGE